MSLRDLFGRSSPPDPKTVSDPVSHGPAAHGKIPAKADFIRINAGAFSAAGLDRVFAEGSEAVMQAGGSLPTESIRFFACPASGPMFVGVFKQSRDKVGRRAPLILFAHLDRCLLGDFPVLMSAVGGFFPPAEYLLGAASELDLESLTAQVGELTDPAEAVTAAVAAANEGIQGRDARASLELALGKYSPETAGFALATVAAGARGSAILSAPAPDEVAMFIWLDALRAHMPTDATPAFLWTLGSAQLIVGTQGLTAGHFLGLCCPERAGPRFWKIVALDDDSAAKGAATLPESVRQLLGGPTLVVDTLSQTLRNR